jgi:hypothetical protein
MKKITLLSISLLLLLSSCSQKTLPTHTKTTCIDQFQSYLIGYFSNQAQINEEIKNGKQIHPLAIHVNAVADEKIIDAPKRDGFWLLQEGYYTFPYKTKQTKPNLFFFEALGEHQVRLYAYKLPENIKNAQIRTENKSLIIDFDDLTPLTTFKNVVYTQEGDAFSTLSKNEVGDGSTFTLIEKLTDGKLEAMELLEKDGKNLTPYPTPILYLRGTPPPPEKPLQYSSPLPTY